MRSSLNRFIADVLPELAGNKFEIVRFCPV